MKLKGKNVFITGSTRGIGLAIAYEFAKEGANVVINGRTNISNELLASLKKINSDIKVIGISGDVSSINEAKRMIEETKKNIGNVDILVNNAGITKDGLTLRMTEEDFESVLKINLTGAFNMTQIVLKPMTRAREGAIINVSSVTGLIGNIGQANYAASKAGLIGLTKSIAREVAGRNVRINAVAPGFIETDMTVNLSEKIKTQVSSQIPMKRFGKTGEVASVVTFLAKQDYMTGQVLTIDGGLVM